MKPSTNMILTQLIERYPCLADIKGEIEAAYELLITCFEAGHRLYLCGNGGSAADSEHMAGELLKCFKIGNAYKIPKTALIEYVNSSCKGGA